MLFILMTFSGWQHLSCGLASCALFYILLCIYTCFIVLVFMSLAAKSNELKKLIEPDSPPLLLLPLQKMFLKHSLLFEFTSNHRPG